MGKLFIAGDTHGNIDIAKIEKFVSSYNKKLSKEDVLIIAGDAGIIWDASSDSEEEKELIDFYTNLPITIAFIDGNHENHWRLSQLPTEYIFDNEVGVVAPNLYHLKRGKIYYICNKTIFTMGGGASIDKNRRQEFISWWKEEIPSFKEMINALEVVEQYQYIIDIVITHTAPLSIFEEMSNELGLEYKNVFEEEELRILLDHLRELAQKYKYWFFGHFHDDWRSKKDPRFVCLFNYIFDID